MLKQTEVAGDHGDPDLAAALKQTSAKGRPVPLVVFGHMHHLLKGGKRRRDMVCVDPDSGTVFLNCAVVPRWGNLPVAPASGASTHQFTVVHMAAGGYVQSASDVWVGVCDGQCHIASEQTLVETQLLEEDRLLIRHVVTSNMDENTLWQEVNCFSSMKQRQNLNHSHA